MVPLPGVVTPLGMQCSPIPDPSQTGAWTDSFQNVQCYDTLKVNAILNQMNGKTHNGQGSAPVPTLFGMNFQAVSVGEKLIEQNVGSGGYSDAAGTPSALLVGEIQFVDAAIGQWVSELRNKGLLDTTLIIITAKHGQSPMILTASRFPDTIRTMAPLPANLIASLLPWSESPLSPTGIGPTEDDLLAAVAYSFERHCKCRCETLEANATQAGIGQIFYGPSITTMFNAPRLPPAGDPRTPDIIVTPNYGVVYTTSSKKQEEHGGFSHDDTNVMMLLWNPSFHAGLVNTPVETMQVAPTVLKALGLDPNQLQAVQLEGTAVLPATQF